MEFQLLRSKTLLPKLEKELKWRKIKAQTPSRRTVYFSSTVASSSTSSSYSPSSSSCPYYCQSEEVSINIDKLAELITEVAAIDLPVYHSESPSKDDGDQGIDISAAAATSNQVDHEQMIMVASSSSELSGFQKSEFSKGTLGIIVTVILALYIYMKTYPDDKSEIPKWFSIFVPSILSFGATFIIIGVILKEMIPLIARVLEVLGFLLVLLGVLCLVSSVIPILVAGLCYIMIVIALLLDLFPKQLAVRICPTLLAWSGDKGKITN